jgi:hypothetical protein
MTDTPPFYQIISEETSFKRITGPTNQESLEVTIESVIRSLAGVTETRTQEFALAGDQAAKLVAAIQTITENIINLVDKSTADTRARYEEAASAEPSAPTEEETPVGEVEEEEVEVAETTTTDG